MTPRLRSRLQEYDAYHRTHGNKICHSVGIPLIVISLFGLLSLIRVAPLPFHAELFRIDGAILFLALALLWYFVLDWKIALPFAFVNLGLYFISRTLPLWAWIVLFTLGWGLQLLGHARFEGNSPAFTKNLEHLLIGPLWIFCHLIGYT